MNAIVCVACAFCGAEASEQLASIHRDGAGVGPEVPLCAACGLNETPTCEEIWDRIAQPSNETFAHRKRQPPELSSEAQEG